MDTETITLRELLYGDREHSLEFTVGAKTIAQTEPGESDYFSDAPLTEHSVGESDPLDMLVIVPAYSDFSDDPQYVAPMK